MRFPRGEAADGIPIHPLNVILHKRDGLTLTDLEIQAFLHAVVHRSDPHSDFSPEVSDAQIAAFLMAVYQRGLDARELATLTQAMRFSGEVFDAAPLGTFTVDKHSTGGVGDKTSLLIAPIVAAAGAAKPTPDGIPGICVPMISGRSLGHTGGTLDKLETIPGFDTQLTLAKLAQVLRESGAAMIGQSPYLVPADRILYALRDHTGTVESPHLIAASIMSKKLAEDLDALVLDVKTGSGAFMKEEPEARQLAGLMVAAGVDAGTTTVALLTRMDQPLGRFAGNYIEIMECVSILQGKAHPLSSDLIELTHILAGWMLHLAKHSASPEEGARLSAQLLTSGAALRQWIKMVDAQGGDSSIFLAPERFHQPAARATLCAPRSGFLAGMDCTQVGWAVQRLGAGRSRPGDPVSPHAGIEVHAKLGTRVEKGQPLVTLFADDESKLHEPFAGLQATYRIAAEPPQIQSILVDTIAAPAETSKARSGG